MKSVAASRRRVSPPPKPSVSPIPPVPDRVSTGTCVPFYGAVS